LGHAQVRDHRPDSLLSWRSAMPRTSIAGLSPHDRKLSIYKISVLHIAQMQIRIVRIERLASAAGFSGRVTPSQPPLCSASNRGRSSFPCQQTAHVDTSMERTILPPARNQWRAVRRSLFRISPLHLLHLLKHFLKRNLRVF
jgi:hypothetical protein